MEDKLVSCKNCQYFIEEHDGNNIHYSCQKTNKTVYPKIFGLLDNCPLSLRDCYKEKVNGENIKSRSDRRSSKHKISNK